MRTHIFILIVLSIFYYSCSNLEHIKPDNIRISFEVDNFLSYALTDNPGKIMFSPIDNVDKIWTTNGYELDLKSGEWELLSAKFGEEFKAQINSQNIWHDSINNEVYISLPRNGLFQFNTEKDTFYKIAIQHVTALHLLKEEVLLGTANGLFFLNRLNRKIKRVPRFPLDVSVNDIQEITADSLLLNRGQYSYDLRSLELTELGEEYQTFSPPKWNHLLMKKLPRLGKRYYLEKDTISRYWFNSHLFFTTDNEVVKRFSGLPDAYLIEVLEDDKYLYLLYKDQLLILNKAFVRAHARIYDVEKSWNLSQELNAKIDAIRANPTTINTLVEQIENLQTDTNYTPYEELALKLFELPRMIERKLQWTNSLRHQTEKAIRENRFPEKYLVYALRGLARYYFEKYELEKAAVYFDLYEAIPSEYGDDDYWHRSMGCVREVVQAMDSLAQLQQIREDERLYKLGQLHEKFLHCDLVDMKDADYSEVLGVYQKLLQKYPYSPYADQAAWYPLMIRGYEEEPWYDPEKIAEFEAFIKRYPNSKLVTRAKLEIGMIYEAYHGEVEYRLKMLDSASQVVADINQLDPNIDSLILIEVKYFQAWLEQNKAQNMFELSATPRQQHYSLEDELIIDVKLTNKTKRAQKIRLFKKHPQFSTLIYAANDNFRFIDKELSDTTTLEVILEPGKPLEESITLNTEARESESTQIGKYEFTKEGVYLLSILGPNPFPRSKNIKFYLEDSSK